MCHCLTGTQQTGAWPWDRGLFQFLVPFISAQHIVNVPVTFEAENEHPLRTYIQE